MNIKRSCVRLNTLTLVFVCVCLSLSCALKTQTSQQSLRTLAILDILFIGHTSFSLTYCS